MYVCIVERLYRGYHWDQAGCPVWRGAPNSEVALYTAGTADSVLIREVSLFRVPCIERFHCTYLLNVVPCPLTSCWAHLVLMQGIGWSRRVSHASPFAIATYSVIIQ